MTSYGVNGNVHWSSPCWLGLYQQGNFSNNNCLNNMNEVWRGNQNQGFGWKQDASPSNR